MPTTDDQPAVPAEICGYRIERPLGPESFLAEAPGGRAIVLKVLDPDCILRRQLHPMVKDRLGRVQELPAVAVANLRGVERDGDVAYLVWEYLPGWTLGEWLARRPRAPDDLRAAAREIVLAVESMHARGLVHGALKASNVIVSPEGIVRLTHASPLLYMEIEVDADAVVQILRDLAAGAGEAGAEMAALAGEADRSPWTLRDLAARLTVIARPAPEAAADARPAAERTVRRGAIVAAVVAAVMGIAVAVAAWLFARSVQRPTSATFRPVPVACCPLPTTP